MTYTSSKLNGLTYNASVSYEASKGEATNDNSFDLRLSLNADPIPNGKLERPELLPAELLRLLLPVLPNRFIPVFSSNLFL